LPHDHDGVTRQQINHHALMRWVEVLHQDGRHAAIGGQRLARVAARCAPDATGIDIDRAIL
jgi:hypothetical protein